MGWIDFRRAKSRPLRDGDRVITLESQALLLRLPFAVAVWNRPVAVQLERAGTVERIPIRDWTRVGELSIAALIMASLFIGIAFQNKGHNAKRSS